jgi:hypothetical protein
MGELDEVQAGLDEAAAQAEKESESPTGETEQVRTKTEETSKAKTVPYDRFQEVNAKFRELETKFAAKEEELSGQARALEKLTQSLEVKEQEALLVEQIRDLYRKGDDTWKATLEKLEKKLQGVEDEVDEGNKTPEEAAKATRELLKKETDTLSTQLSAQRVDLIATKADTLATEYLEALPEEYTESDRIRIAHLLQNQVDWEAIESADDWNTALIEEIPRALEHIVNNIYQEPTGITVQSALEEAKQRAEKEVNTVDRIAELREKSNKLLGKEWGKAELSKDNLGRIKSIDSKMSDDEFSRAMAEQIRLRRAIESAEEDAKTKAS